MTTPHPNSVAARARWTLWTWVLHNGDHLIKKTFPWFAKDAVKHLAGFVLSILGLLVSLLLLFTFPLSFPLWALYTRELDRREVNKYTTPRPSNPGGGKEYVRNRFGLLVPR